MDKTIYISDLDGTLLNSQRKIPEFCVKQLNQLIEEEGLHFSVATARTPATVENILQDVRVKEPIVVMNGVALYDLNEHRYLQVEYITPDIAKSIINLLGEWVEQGFIYTINQNKLTVHYNQLVGKGRINFYEERKALQYKKFTNEPLSSYEDVIYFVFIDTKENIQTIYNLLEPVEGIGKVMYKDIYCKESYLLEVYSNKATKANGIKKLKETGTFNKVICFGDQMNDLNMFQEADEAYAVGNAVKEIKKLATAVIGTNDEGSVVQFITKHMKCLEKEID